MRRQLETERAGQFLSPQHERRTGLGGSIDRIEKEHLLGLLQEWQQPDPPGPSVHQFYLRGDAPMLPQLGQDREAEPIITHDRIA
jgi:hypothetical protein